MNQILECEFDDDVPAPMMRLRPYQTECIDAVDAGWQEATRQIVVMSGGCGKTVVFANIARLEVERGGKVLIVAHTDELLEQAIDKLKRATGIDADKEKADDHASLFAPVVIASVQTLTRTDRLTGFPDNFFSLVIVDECHRSLSKSYLKVIYYFHYGAESLREGWEPPEIGVEYKHKARILGMSVGPDSWVELRGGPFGLGFSGTIDDAFSIASTNLPSRKIADFDVIDMLCVQSRGWTGRDFAWRQCFRILRHRTETKPCTMLSFHGTHRMIATDDHSVYVARNGVPVRVVTPKSTNIKFTPRIICERSDAIKIGDTLIGDSGSGWDSNVPDPLVDVIKVCVLGKFKSSASVSCNVATLDRLHLRNAGMSHKEIWKARNRGSLSPAMFLRLEDKGLVATSIRTHRTSISRFVRISDWAYILGFWLGDGWLGNKSSRGRFSLAVENESAEFISGVLKGLPNMKWNVKTKPGHGASVEVQANSITFCDLLRSILGEKPSCYNKFIPGEWIISWPKERRIELLRGIMDSDGCAVEGGRNRKRHTVVTSSIKLARGVLSLLRSLGVRGGLHQRTSCSGGTINGRKINGKPGSFSVSWSGWHFSSKPSWNKCGNRKKFLHVGLSFSEAIVRDTSPTESPEFVYDMEMDGASFVADGVLVHNTATASRGDKRDLGELYQKIAFDYGLLEAVRDGYLVKPIVKNIPLKIDMRGVRISRAGGAGADFDLGEVTSRIAPILREIAKQLAFYAKTLKTVVFTPSIETARLLAEALTEEGMNASYVSGACDDRDEKIVAFRAAGPGTIMTNALLIVEGFDVPDITGVCILRPTKIWSFFVQASVRGTRTLPGLIDHLETREQRLAAIAASAKSEFTIFDFLWITDRLDLIQPVDLVAKKPAIRKLIAESGATDLVAAEGIAERDLLKSLTAAAKKHARKQARVIDPIALSVSLGDASLATYEPETQWDMKPMSPGQKAFLDKQGVDTSKIGCSGLASKIISRVIVRLNHRLATPRQLSLMHQLGLDEQTCATLTVAEATVVIDRAFKDKRSNPVVGPENLPDVIAV